MISFKKQQTRARQAMILDTCALIDGRIIDIAKTGFVPQDLVIPQFVVAELQYLADNGDSHKRERARFGLDVIRELQQMRRVEVTIARAQFNNIKEVDDKLIALAKQYGAMLYTTDFNLNKVAQIEGVQVLNVNELAQALRPPRLPGEKLELKITQVGQDKSQGVGYLDDGTMVVVEKAGNRIGQKVAVEFSRILQTQAGKMMFAVLTDKPEKPNTAPPPKTNFKPKQSNNSSQQRISGKTLPTQPHNNTPSQPAQAQHVQRPQNEQVNAWHSHHQNHKPHFNSNRRPIQKPIRRSPEDSLLRALEKENQ